MTDRHGFLFAEKKKIIVATKAQRHEDLKSEEVKIFGHELQKAQEKSCEWWVVSCEKDRRKEYFSHESACGGRIDTEKKRQKKK